MQENASLAVLQRQHQAEHVHNKLKERDEAFLLKWTSIMQDTIILYLYQGWYKTANVAVRRTALL